MSEIASETPAEQAPAEAIAEIAPAATNAAGVLLSAKDHADAARVKAVEALTALRETLPDVPGDLDLGHCRSDIDCALALMKPKEA